GCLSSARAGADERLRVVHAGTDADVFRRAAVRRPTRRIRVPARVHARRVQARLFSAAAAREHAMGPAIDTSAVPHACMGPSLALLGEIGDGCGVPRAAAAALGASGTVLACARFKTEDGHAGRTAEGRWYVQTGVA